MRKVSHMRQAAKSILSLLIICSFFGCSEILLAVELLTDPGFEAVEDNAEWGWRRHSSTPPRGFQIDKKETHGGKQYLKLRVVNGKTEAATYQQLRILDLKNTYVLSVWARGKGKLLMYAYQYSVKTEGGKYESTDLAQLKLAKQKIVSLRSLHKNVNLTKKWKRYKFTFTPDSKASSISAAFHVRDGWADIDDASLVIEGEKADEVSLPLRFVTLKGCAFDNSVLRPFTESVESEFNKGVVMEPEYAYALSLEQRGGIHFDEKNPQTQYIDYANGISFKFKLKTSGRYQAWYRINIPFVANWGHSETLDGKDRDNQDATKKDSPPPNTWVWRPGPITELSEGTHVWRFNNWYGGIRLDQVALLPAGVKPSRNKEALPASPLKIAAKIQATSADVKPYSIKKWRRFSYQSYPKTAQIQFEYSSDQGATWSQITNPNDIGASAVGRPLRIRCSFPSLTGKELISAERLAIIENPSVVYAPGKTTAFKISGKQCSFQIKGQNGKLLSLKNSRLGIQYSLPGNTAQPLFLIKERKLGLKGKFEIYTPLDGQLLEAKLIKNSDGQRYCFTYSLCNDLIIVKGYLQADDTEIIRGSIEVAYKGDDEIVAVDFPLLNNLAIGSRADDDILIMPFVQGMKIPHPAKESFSYPRYWTWPGSLSMCYVDLYDQKNNAGLYLSSYDDKFTTTQFLLKGSIDGKSMNMGLRKWIRLRKGQSYKSPEAIIGLHQGDWHWGADRYREWANTWFKKGNTPRWFQESDGYVMGGPLWYGCFDQSLLGSAEKCAEYGNGLVAGWGHMATINSACGIYPYPSPWYGGVNNFRWTNKKIHELGAHSNYYIQGHLINPMFNRNNSFLANLPKKYFQKKDWNLLPDKNFFKRVRIIEPNGSSDPPYRHAEQHADPAKKEFRDYLVAWTLRYIRDYQADGMYFDGFAIGPAYPSINYDDASSTTGDWGRSQLDIMRRCKEQGRKLNPDVVLGMEGCSDVYQQFGDWGLMSGQNAMEMFRYTFPELIVVGGSSNGNVKMAVEQVFMNAFRMNEMLHNTEDPNLPKHKYYLRPWTSRVAAIRKIINPFLLRARFMDTVGVKADNEVDARLMVRNSAGNKGCLVLIHNRAGKTNKKVIVETSEWGPVKASWLVTWKGVKPLAMTKKNGKCSFTIPTDKFAAVLLINKSEPLVDKRLLPLGVPKDTVVAGPVSILNVNPTEEKVLLSVIDGKGFKSEKVACIAKPGIITRAIIPYQLPAKTFQLDKRLDLFLQIKGKSKTNWLLPARCIPSVDARLARVGEKKMLLTLKNRTNRQLQGDFSIGMEFSEKIKFTPAKQEFILKPNQKLTIPIQANLVDLHIFESAVANIEISGSKNIQAYAGVGPYVMNADFELSSFNLPIPLADGGWEYDRLFQKTGDYTYDKLKKFPQISYRKPYHGKGCLRIPKGSPYPHIVWNAWLAPNKKYRVKIAIKRTTKEGGGFQMSMAGDICKSPWLGNTKNPKLNEWEVFEGTFKTIGFPYFWQVIFHTSKTGDIFYDALEIEEIE